MTVDPYRIKEYESINGSLSGGKTNLEIDFGKLVEVLHGYIINESFAGAFTVKFNGTNNTENPATIIKARERYNFSNESITGIYLTNRSGQEIPYRIQLWGNE